MSQVSANIDGKVLDEFRKIIFYKYGLKKGDFKRALEDAMLDYVIKYSKSDDAKLFAKRAKAENSL